MSEEKFKEEFNKTHKTFFSEYFDTSKMEKRIPSYQYLMAELKKLEDVCPEKQWQHVYSKKKTLLSKNAKKLCRDGVPLRYIKPFILKMFNIEFTDTDYSTKSKLVFKGRELSSLGDFVPYFTNKTLDESLPVHFLTDKGVQTLKEIMWLLNSVIPIIEYSPLIIKVTSLLLILFTKEETYEIMRTLLELNLSPPEINKIRWHFRFTYSENLKIGNSITESILNLADDQTKTRFKALDELGCPKEKLVQDLSESFFLDYLNFVGVFRFLPFFLYEGTKSIYRLSYSVIKDTKYSAIKKGKEKDVLANFKAEAYKLSNLTEEFETSYKFQLNRNNNKYITQEIANIDDLLSRRSYYFLPYFSPKSEILNDSEIIKLWSLLPLEIKTFDGKLLYSQKTSPNADLDALYEICEPNDKMSEIMIIIQTDKDEVFGGIFSNNIQICIDGNFLNPKSKILFTIKPEVKIYSPDKDKTKIALFEPGAIRYGIGEDGDAFCIGHDLKSGWSEKNTVFGEVELVKEGGEFNIKNMEVYLMI